MREELESNEEIALVQSLAVVAVWRRPVGGRRKVARSKVGTQVGHGGCRKKDKLCILQRRATQYLMISCFLIVVPTLPVSSLEFKEDVTGDLFSVLSGSRLYLHLSPQSSAGALLDGFVWRYRSPLSRVVSSAC